MLLQQSTLDGIEHITTSDGSEFSACTTGAQRTLAGAFYPESASDIQLLVNWANQHHKKLWPISTGKNWGYGTALPVKDQCYIVYLGKLTGISNFNTQTGTITLEPGVTQGMLYEFLKGSDYICPVTGAGPEVSILGNLLERGYGLAPVQDHFSSLLSISAILGNGERYLSPLQNIAGVKADHAFKWGIGPYLDGLFSQSNFGIVTDVTIQLAKKRAHQRLVKLSIKDKQLFSVISTVQAVLQDYEGIISGINLMNNERVAAMGVKNPPEWTGIFAISSTDRKIVDIAYRSIKSRLKPYCSILSINTKLLNLLSRLPLPESLQKNIAHACAIRSVLNGEPTTMALNLAYKHNATSQRTSDPARDECGLIWYAPLVPMEQRSIEMHINNVRKHCLDNDIAPLITFTSLGAKCFDSTVPILFNKHNELHKEQAKRCFNNLLSEGQKLGLFPYRLPIDAMPYLTIQNLSFFKQTKRVKQALDPNGVIAPGRYNLT